MKTKGVTAPVRKTMCATCPFRPGSPYMHLMDDIARSALNEGMRECHCTGTNAVGGKTGQPVQFCRGAFEIQAGMFAALGLLKQPTLTEWNRHRKKLGMAALPLGD